MAEPIPMEVPSRKSTGLRGRKLMFPSPIVADKIKPRRPFTRAATKQNVPVKSDVAEISAQRKGKSKLVEQPIEIVDITTPQEESNPTFKRLKRQLKEARVEVDRMKKEDLSVRRKFKEVLDIHVSPLTRKILWLKYYFPSTGSS
jgi:hypothetical protein